jgi:hypothetical protein
MKKPIALLIAVWGSAFATAAFAYTVHRPVAALAAPHREAASVPAPSASLPSAELAMDVIELDVVELPRAGAKLAMDNVIELPTQVITGQVTRPPALAHLAQRAERTLRCSDWKSLTQGSVDQQVRYCE